MKRATLKPIHSNPKAIYSVLDRDIRKPYYRLQIPLLDSLTKRTVLEVSGPMQKPGFFLQLSASDKERPCDTRLL